MMWASVASGVFGFPEVVAFLGEGVMGIEGNVNSIKNAHKSWVPDAIKKMDSGVKKIGGK